MMLVSLPTSIKGVEVLENWEKRRRNFQSCFFLKFSPGRGIGVFTRFDRPSRNLQWNVGKIGFRKDQQLLTSGRINEDFLDDCLFDHEPFIGVRDNGWNKKGPPSGQPLIV